MPVAMSLSASPFPSSGPLTGDAPGAEWSDSLYGSLAVLGPRKMKKKPVLVLDEQELAKAHMAIAMGGAEIMESADMVPAPRTPQPAIMLGLAPMGRDEPEDDPQLYPQHAFAPQDAEEPGFAETPEDEADAGPETPASTFTPADSAEDEESLEELDEAPAPLPSYSLDHLLGAARGRPLVDLPGETDDDDDEDAVPSIAEQLQRMRERTSRAVMPHITAPPIAPVASAPPPAPAEPAPPVQEPAPAMDAREPVVEIPDPNVERLEIDDWSQINPRRAILPPLDSAAPAPPPVAEEGEPTVPPEPAHVGMSPSATPPAAAPASLPLNQEDRLEDEWDMYQQDTAEWSEHPAPAAPAEPALVAAMARRTSPVLTADALSSDLDSLAQPLADQPSPSALRARIREKQADQRQGTSPSLLARLVRWLQGLLGR